MAVFLEEYLKEHSIDPNLMIDNAVAVIENHHILKEHIVIQKYWEEMRDFLMKSLLGMSIVNTSDQIASAKMVIYIPDQIPVEIGIVVRDAIHSLTTRKILMDRSPKSILNAIHWTLDILTIMDKIHEKKRISSIEKETFKNIVHSIKNSFRLCI